MTGKAAAPGATDTPRHLPALDGLRAIAILLVIPHNVYVFERTGGWLAPFAWLANAGWIGVQLFFVLSGFLITRNLLDSRGASNYYSAFFGRRILRIFPLYFLAEMGRQRRNLFECAKSRKIPMPYFLNATRRA
jgi:peptidoglycan/LPS O-acetylase OafA/YrhL